LLFYRWIQSAPWLLELQLEWRQVALRVSKMEFLSHLRSTKDLNGVILIVH
jgi:hypothetical protein